MFNKALAAEQRSLVLNVPEGSLLVGYAVGELRQSLGFLTARKSDRLARRLGNVSAYPPAELTVLTGTDAELAITALTSLASRSRHAEGESWVNPEAVDMIPMAQEALIAIAQDDANGLVRLAS